MMLQNDIEVLDGDIACSFPTGILGFQDITMSDHQLIFSGLPTWLTLSISLECLQSGVNIIPGQILWPASSETVNVCLHPYLESS